MPYESGTRRLIQAGGILASVACILLLTAEDLNPGDPREAAVLEALENLCGDAVCGTVHQVRLPRLWGADETFYLTPFLEWEIGDVGTAGSSDWYLMPGVLALAWRGGEAIEPRKVSLEASTLQIEADGNTYLLWEGNSLQQRLEGPFPGRTEKTACGTMCRPTRRQRIPCRRKTRTACAVWHGRGPGAFGRAGTSPWRCTFPWRTVFPIEITAFDH